LAHVGGPPALGGWMALTSGGRRAGIRGPERLCGGLGSQPEPTDTNPCSFGLEPGSGWQRAAVPQRCPRGGPAEARHPSRAAALCQQFGACQGPLRHRRDVAPRRPMTSATPTLRRRGEPFRYSAAHALGWGFMELAVAPRHRVCCSPGSANGAARRGPPGRALSAASDSLTAAGGRSIRPVPSASRCFPRR